MSIYFSFYLSPFLYIHSQQQNNNSTLYTQNNEWKMFSAQGKYYWLSTCVYDSTCVIGERCKRRSMDNPLGYLTHSSSNQTYILQRNLLFTEASLYSHVRVFTEPPTRQSHGWHFVVFKGILASLLLVVYHAKCTDPVFRFPFDLNTTCNMYGNLLNVNIYLSVYLPTYLYIYLHIYLPVCLPLCLSLYPSLYQPTYMYLIYVPTYLTI